MSMVPRVCEICKTVFTRYAAHLRTPGQGRFCSKRCANKGLEKGVTRGADACIKAAYASGARAWADGTIYAADGHAFVPHKHKKTGFWRFTAPLCAAPMDVHRFVAYQLFGHIALDAECVRHVDGNRDNNSIHNITYGPR